MQDRSACLTVRVLQPLLYEKADVLVVGSFSALTVAHIATVAASRVGRVLVCSTDHTPSQVKEMRELLAQMDIQSEWRLDLSDRTVEHMLETFGKMSLKLYLLMIFLLLSQLEVP